eukprot:TRINITY_DN9687_c0_g1_i1.p1 TRINITY_DN9687_c0_g1~~TRINITY_DN9687_c0_g1_i1.p1  ORF type:complete len:747 (+),score=276.18 TRINITY_DN9687_c0_g1_i1:79-2319(+)
MLRFISTVNKRSISNIVKNEALNSSKNRIVSKNRASILLVQNNYSNVKLVQEKNVFINNNTSFISQNVRDKYSFSSKNAFLDEKEPKEAELRNEENEKEPLEAEVLNDSEEGSSSQNQSSETVIGQQYTHEFQAETRKILDIVAKSLYTDKEVFVRELISNSSDALEKLRHREVSGEEIIDDYLQPEINIITNEENNTLTIQDFGIGMTKDELINNLGRIGKSGTEEFIKNIEAGNSDSLIGQFGVGFYSAFMVADTVTVYSKHSAPDSQGFFWSSDGSGQYTLAEADGVARGTKIVLHLRSDAKEFSKTNSIKSIVEKYSNFVNFDIKLNDERINKIKAIWTLPKKDITKEQHLEFYRFISNAYDTPLYNYQFQSESPINIKSLFYFPESHMEKFGMPRLDSGISLYCKKVLISPKMKGILPDYLRFVKGVVDCEDVPLNLSREHLQDSALIARIRDLLTKKILKFLNQISKKDEKKYLQFFKEFGNFIKEGCVDGNHKEEICKLLRMNSSRLDSEDDMTSMDEYIDNMPESQTDIYYLVSPKRDFALTSPYYEAFKKKNIEVLFFYNVVDDGVLSHIGSYRGKRFVGIDSNDVKLDDILKDESKDSKDSSDDDSEVSLSEEEIKGLERWIKDTLVDKVSAVKESTRLHSSPAIVIDNESASFRRLMKFADPSRSPPLPKQTLEINVKHPIITKLSQMRESKPEVSKLIIEQIFDNALITAGLIDDPRSMVSRLNDIMEKAISDD